MLQPPNPPWKTPGIGGRVEPAGDLWACGIVQAVPGKERNYANPWNVIITVYVCRQHFSGEGRARGAESCIDIFHANVLF